MKLRTWRVPVIGSRGQVLGDVEASDQQTAEAAVTKFNLSDEQRKRLVVQERV